MSDHEQITIHQTVFRVPMRYKEGHALTTGEANALNQALHSSLRNIWAPRVKTGLANGETPETLQTKLDAYAADYQFGARRRRGSTAAGPDPANAIALTMARDLVRKAAKAKGLNWPTSKVSEAASQLLARQGDNGTLITQARQRVEAERIAGQAIMEDVDSILHAA